MADTNDELKAKYPFYLPLVSPPDDWTAPNDGGYPSNVFMRWPLVHQYSKKAPKLTKEEMPEVYESVNSLQRVAWRINDFVFAVFDHYWREGQEVADIPGGNLRELPPKPEDIGDNPDSRRDWKRKASAIYNINVKLGTKKILYGKIHFVARHYQYQDFWFPYKLDFRGRAYPIPAFLNPQGCPLSKGLLRFSEGKRITTDEAAGWFFIHGANTWGLDKVSFEERIAWVGEHDNFIRDIAADPLTNRGWEEADSPWQFLAWCEEYANWYEAPDTFQSHLPIAMDGTNNGLQIYSLLLRDPVGAEATNVSPTDKPRDIYQDVADDVTRMLQEETDERYTEYARNWLSFSGGHIPRACCKRPVMVLPYGGTSYSIRQYVEDWYEELLVERGLELDRPFPTTFHHTRYLTQLILSAISSRLVGATTGMAWLRDIANLCSDHKVAIQWTTPTKFKVFQLVPNLKKITISTQIGKHHRCRKVFLQDELSISRRGQADGLAPNFIHSLDAAIMTLTTQRATAEGIVNLNMVHDSFACHAADAPRLAEILRQVVVEVFSVDRLAEFRAEIQRLLGPTVDVPEVPPLGTLDVTSVVNSSYFFA